MMKKLLAAVLCATVIFASVTGCTDTPSVTDTRDVAAVTDTDTADVTAPATAEVTEPADSTAEVTADVTAEATAPAEKFFTFQPKVSSFYTAEIYPERMIQTWYNLVDAVLAGEDSFACPDKHCYLWVVWHFPTYYFPALVGTIDTYDDYDIDSGFAPIKYNVPKEELAARIAGFSELVEDILNSALRPEYSDFEKMLALYDYFANHYVYDYDAAEKIKNKDPKPGTSCYRLMTEGIGVCADIAQAYSYLLMQVGLDATTMNADSLYDTTGHEWSLVRLKGSNYHVDPTFILGMSTYLGDFMMTDTQRYATYESTNWNTEALYSGEDGPILFHATDETFAPIWSGDLVSFDHDAHTLHYVNSLDYTVTGEFDYGDF